MPKRKRIHVHDERTAALVRDVVRSIDEGAIVELETESTLERTGLAGAFRNGEKLNLLIHGSAADELLKTAPPHVHRLADRYWPGPLVIAIPAPPELYNTPAVRSGFVYLRMPAGAVVESVIEKVRGPVFSEEEPGAARAAGLPAIVKTAPGLFVVEREGLLSAGDITKTAGRRILIVCTGNTCRSPMAAAVLRERMIQILGGPARLSPREQARFLAQFGYRIESAGIAPYPGTPASPHAMAAVAELKYSLEGHESQQASPELLEEFDLALALTSHHARRLRDIAPPHLKIEPLDPVRDIDDPYGGPIEIYRSTLARIREVIEQRLPALL